MSILESALEYAEKGFYVTPLHCRGKHMFTGKDFGTPSKDPDKIKYWWKEIPNANLGLPTSIRRNALIVIDIDIKNGVDGRKSLEMFSEKIGLAIPDTCVVKTGSGGYHMYYRNSTGSFTTGGKNILPGVDIRAENAHVVAPPSIHENGRCYEWVKGNIDYISDASEYIFKLADYKNQNNH